MVNGRKRGLTQADLAHALDISPAMVSKLKARGMPVHSVAEAVAWREANLDPILCKNIRRSGLVRDNQRPNRNERRSCAQPLTANAKRRRPRGGMIDPVMADEALRWQPAAFVEREPADTPEARILAAWESRLVPAQSEIMRVAFAEIRRAGGTASNGAAFRTALGKLWGRIRALVDSERDVLEREVGELVRR